MALAPGARFSRYEIVSLLGAGGMGEVYRARDTQLGREVAIKLLPDAYTQDADRVHRFVQEAKAASSLNHPNILTVHEIGQAGGLHFIATELIDGQTLRQRLIRSELTPAEALDIALQTAGALVAAHAAGVVHRDIKPENIMIRADGYVKVLDFGLAKLAQATSDVPAPDTPTAAHMRTLPGVVLGTERYMSPEQVRGLTVDARTDLFSLGVVIYEMFAGRRPFDGATPGDVTAAILQKEPAPLARSWPEAPGELERIVAKALRKDREERYQTAKDLQLDLKGVRRLLDVTSSSAVNAVAATAAPTAAASSSAGPVKRSRIALALAALVLAAGLAIFYVNRHPSLTDKDTVLLADFVNTTGEAVFDGTLKQALAVQLRQTPFLNLFPEEAIGETLRLMDRPPDTRVTQQVAREICQRQNLKALIVGTIATLGRTYIVTLEAINGQTGDTIASQQTEAAGKEQVLRALGEAATGLRRGLGESLSTIQQYNAPIERVTTSSLEALKIYSTAFDQFIIRGDARGSLPLFTRAIEIDPDFAEAYDSLAWVSINLGDLRKAAELAEKAYALRDRVTELERFSITDTYLHFAIGDLEKENESNTLAQRLYPNDWNWPHTLAINHTGMGMDDKAVAEERLAIRLNPNVVHPYRFLAIALLHLNRFDEAKDVIRQTQARKLDGPFFRATLFQIAAAQDDRAAMQEQLHLIREKDSAREAVTWQARAAVASGRWREAQALYADTGLPIDVMIRGTLLGFCAPAGSAPALAVSRISSPGQVLLVPVQSNGSLCGDAGDARTLADELQRRYPAATKTRTLAVPVIRAAAELASNQPERAIEMLKAAVPYEGGALFWPTYLRGQAYLRLRQSSQAAAQFRTIIDHRGWDALSTLYPLAHVGLARALSLAGDNAGSRKAYQDFFAMWKDADADLPVVLEAKKGYEAQK